MKIYLEILAHSWVGGVLLLLAAFVLSASLCLIILRYRDASKESVCKQKILCTRILRLSANLAPSLGLLGTVLGLLQGFMVSTKDELPRMMGQALTTTFVGSLLFVISYFILFIQGSNEKK